jgi:hypothetical protein
MVSWRYVTPGYFATLGIPIRHGRSFTEADRGAAVYSVVLSESLARKMFPGENPIGRHILGDTPAGWFTVVGVSADVRNRGPEKAIEPEFYLVRKPVPDVTWANQEPPMGWAAATAVVRTAIDPRLVANELRQTIAGIDATLPVEIGAMRERVDGVTQRPRFYTRLLAAFAGVGVALAGIGLFGVMSFLVARRRREIGVRMALGATPAVVLRHVLAFAARWTLAGLALGAVAAAATQWLRSLLFQVEPSDPWAFAAAALLLLVVGIASAATPALRAAALDPAETLREE